MTECRGFFRFLSRSSMSSSGGVWSSHLSPIKGEHLTGTGCLSPLREPLEKGMNHGKKSIKSLLLKLAALHAPHCEK